MTAKKSYTFDYCSTYPDSTGEQFSKEAVRKMVEDHREDHLDVSVNFDFSKMIGHARITELYEDPNRELTVMAQCWLDPESLAKHMPDFNNQRVWGVFGGRMMKRDGDVITEAKPYTVGLTSQPADPSLKPLTEVQMPKIATTRYDPYRQFRFIVEINAQTLGFSEVWSSPFDPDSLWLTRGHTKGQDSSKEFIEKALKDAEGDKGFMTVTLFNVRDGQMVDKRAIDVVFDSYDWLPFNLDAMTSGFAEDKLVLRGVSYNGPYTVID